MANINKIRRCYNCGAILQCDDEDKPGYVKKETFENNSQNFLFCDKCFENERYKPSFKEPGIDKDFLTLLKDAKKKNSLIVYVINLFSFEASFNHEINEIIKDLDMIVVGNKFDLLPPNTKKEDITNYVMHQFENVGYKNLKLDDIYIASAFDDATTKEIIEKIYFKKQKRDVYVVGPAMSGKSTLIASFLRNITNLSNGNIVTQPYPNTQLNVMKIPFNKKTAMYDTPGLDIDNSILYGLDKATFKDIYLTKQVNSNPINMLTNQSLFIGGFAIIELLESKNKRNLLDLYFNDHIQIKKNIIKIKNIDERFINTLNKKLIKPIYNKIHSIKDLDIYDIFLDGKEKKDIGILGLGWISVNPYDTKLRIYVPKGVSIFVGEEKAK